MHEKKKVFDSPDRIRTHGPQKLQFWQTGALATAAMTSGSKFSNIYSLSIHRTFEATTLRGRHKQARGRSHIPLNCNWLSHLWAPIPGCRPLRKFILTMLRDIFQKFTNTKKIKKPNHKFSTKQKKFFGLFFFLNSCENLQIGPQTNYLEWN